MQSLKNRLDRLENPPEYSKGALLPRVVSDDTTDAELDKLRRDGIEVYRLCDAVDVFV